MVRQFGKQSLRAGESFGGMANGRISGSPLISAISGASTRVHIPQERMLKDGKKEGKGVSATNRVLRRRDSIPTENYLAPHERALWSSRSQYGAIHSKRDHREHSHGLDTLSGRSRSRAAREWGDVKAP